ncbi:hypothetical protein GCM10010277_05870 [Streptomyces longisporoflavus]|nr:hypothetical protein GCM10010277_05870 [Streptomyces longisporoflavus]
MVRARDATRHRVPMIAVLLVRTFTVILLEAAKGRSPGCWGQREGKPAPARNQGGGMVCYWPRMRILRHGELV